MAPDQRLDLLVFVTVNEGASGSLTNAATVSGGGAAPVSTEAATAGNEINPLAAPFGVHNFDFFISGLDGARDSRAGDHPYELTTTFELSSVLREIHESGGAGQKAVYTSGSVRDIVVDLPLGFLGSTLSAPECPLSTLASEKHCPPDTIVGDLHDRTAESHGYRQPDL